MRHSYLAKLAAFGIAVAIAGGFSAIRHAQAAPPGGTGPVDILPSLSNEGAWRVASAVNIQVDAREAPQDRPDTFGAIVRLVDGVDSDIAIAPLKPIRLVDGHTYTLSMMARANGNHPIRVFAQTKSKHQHLVGLNFSAEPGFAYQTFTKTFVAQNVNNHPVLFAVAIGSTTGAVWVRALSLKDMTPNGPANANSPTT